MNLTSQGSAAIEANMPPFASQNEQAEKCSIERNDPPALSLDERGMILECSKSFEVLFGFRRSSLVWHHISMLFPKLTGVELVQAGQLNPLLKYLCRCGQLYLAQNKRGDTFASYLSFVHIEYGGKRSLRLIVRPLDRAGA
jgi:PAS fold